MTTNRVPLAPGRLYFKPFDRSDPSDEPVTVWAMHPALLRWWLDATEALAARGLYSMATSANDEEHRAGSHHYTGDAIDLRSNHVPRGALDLVFGELEQLGRRHRVRVILEGRGRASEHFHAEYRPDLLPDPMEVTRA